MSELCWQNRSCLLFGKPFWQITDLPWATTPIALRLIVRRCRCGTYTCRRQTFAEQLPTVASLYARTTRRLATTQAHTELALGGAAGARHLSRQGSPVSRNTLLRRVRSLPLPGSSAPQIIESVKKSGISICINDVDKEPFSEKGLKMLQFSDPVTRGQSD